jgi:hypothetical protein
MASPALYRAMLNAAYRGWKGVDAGNYVVSAGTAPYGDPDPGGRIAPVAFVRALFCLDDRLRPLKCADPAHLDAISHHPYAVHGPREHAINSDDAAVPDIVRLTRPLRRAVATGRALPKATKGVWVTEMSWDSSPPDPNGVPEARHARWLEDAFYTLWKQGVSVITWFRVVDQAPTPSYGATNQSGVFERNGRAKAAATAYRFPFVGRRRSRSSVLYWGRAPSSGTVTIEVKRGGAWIAVAHRSVTAGTPFTGTFKAGAPVDIRARDATVTSLVWHQP